MERNPRQVNEKASMKISRSSAAGILKFIVLLAAVFWLLKTGTERLSYNWQWYRIPRYIFTFDHGHFSPGPLLKGLWMTVYLSAISLLFAFAIGLVAAVLRLSRSPVARFVARAYLELTRNTPLLVQIFFVYFVLGPVLGIDRLAAAVLSLSFFEGAYASEIFRAGIISIDQGQWEGAYSLGLNTFQAYRLIILPQAVRNVLPPLTSQAVSLIKDSALVSTIAVYDLAMRGEIIVSETFLTFEVWFTVAAFYLIITVTLSLTAGMIENHMRARL
jgi:polar amino acid transport system permease protein